MANNTFIQTIQQERNEEEENNDDQRPKQSIFLKIIKNRLYQLAAFFTIFAFVIPFLFYYIFFDLQVTYSQDEYSCFVNTTFRVPCRYNITRYECLGYGCCFDISTLECYHSFPSRYNYHLQGNSFLSTREFSQWGQLSKPELKMSIIELDQNRVQVVVHDPHITWEEKAVDEKNYRIKRNDLVLSVVIEDSKDQEILTTNLGPLIASDGYWEWTFRITDDALFGLDDLYFEDNVTTTKVIYKNKNDHTTVPVFMGYLRRAFHGLVVENPGPMELIILPSKLVIIRCLAGSYISLTLSMGPTPRDVMNQLRTYEFQLPPQWILGSHICRDGPFNVTVAVEEYQSFLNNANNTVNYASDCFHENLYFEYLQYLNISLSDITTQATRIEEELLEILTDTTTETTVTATVPEEVIEEEPQSIQDLRKLMEALRELQNRTKLLLSFQPQIIFDEENPHFQLANELNVLYRNTNGDVFNGTYLSRQVAYPDVTSTDMVSWLQNLFNDLQVENVFGYVLKDNWPAEETVQMEAHTSLPYLTEDLLSSMSHTLQWNSSTSQNVKHIQLHNNYGTKHVELLREVVQNAILFTSSYNYGTDAIAQIQNFNISWNNLAKMIRRTLAHCMLVHPLISMPVCGSTSNYDGENHETLCMRWYITAATMPILKISSELPRRDPANLSSGLASREASKAIGIRDMLLPYYYTTLSLGDPITRPMLFDFYEDRNTFTLDQQYMVGDGLLVAQPLLQHTTSLRVYLPPQVGVWYEFFGGLKYEDLGWIRLSARETDWFVFIMQGKILPLRKRRTFTPVEENDKSTRLGAEATWYSYSLAIALNLTDNTAAGSLFLSRTYLEFVANGTHVQILNINAAKNDINCEGERLLPSIIESVQIYGIEDELLIRYFTDMDTDLCNVVGNTFDIPYFV